MRTIDKPDDDPKDVFLQCISCVRNVDLKTRMESVAENINSAANKFDLCGVNKTFYQLQDHENIEGVVSNSEMERVYTARMAKKGKPARPIYDKLRASAPHSICPLCGHRTVSTLDHYLPKASFPSLAVVPYNLVPACSDCNKLKLNVAPTTAEEQTMHPYYDDITTEQWLYAEVIEVEPASFGFFVRVNENWDDSLKARIQKHYEIFELGELYISQSGTELSNIRYQLNNVFEKNGEEGVREHLHESFESRRDNHINSWQTAMYEAMANCDWFCNGGFRAI